MPEEKKEKPELDRKALDAVVKKVLDYGPAKPKTTRKSASRK